MSDLTKLTEAQIKLSLDVLHIKGKEIHDQRKALEDEQKRRMGSVRAGIFSRMLGHANFGASFFAKVTFRIRIPDGDWIEGDSEAEDLKHEALDLFKNGSMTLGEHQYEVSSNGEHIYVSPRDSKSVEAWSHLISIVPATNAFDTAWSLDTADIPMGLLRKKISGE